MCTDSPWVAGNFHWTCLARENSGWLNVVTGFVQGWGTQLLASVHPIHTLPLRGQQPFHRKVAVAYTELGNRLWEIAVKHDMQPTPKHLHWWVLPSQQVLVHTHSSVLLGLCLTKVGLKWFCITVWMHWCINDSCCQSYSWDCGITIRKEVLFSSRRWYCNRRSGFILIGTWFQCHERYLLHWLS